MSHGYTAREVADALARAFGFQVPSREDATPILWVDTVPCFAADSLDYVRIDDIVTLGNEHEPRHGIVTDEYGIEMIYGERQE